MRKRGKDKKVLEALDGSRTVRSAVTYSKEEGRFLVGTDATRQAAIKQVVFSVKRLMGQDLEKNEIREKYKDRFIFVRDTKDGEEVLLTPEQISAHILNYLTSYAEDRLGEKIKKVVITVPAYFDDNQRQATKNAGIIAGLEVERIINEPTAAALAYGLDKAEKEQTILVYDLGGGTFDVSVLQISEGVFEVLSTAGINTLGGDDFDKKIVDYLIQEFEKENKIDLRTKDQKEIDRRMTLQRLQEEATKAKHDLSGSLETTVSLPYIASKNEKAVHLEIKITRAKFEKLIEGLVKETMKEVDKALQEAKKKSGKGLEIQQIVLVGGSTRVQLVQEEIKRKFGDKKINKSVNPDEVVAIGAAIQGAVLRGDIKDVVLLDVTPLSLGIATLGARGEGEINDIIIPRNTTIPTSVSRVYSTAEDNQTSVHIRPLQGERTRAMDNKVLGSFELSGIKLAPRGVPQIEVTFGIDSNGIINVKAQDKETGKKAEITIRDSQNLSEAEVQKMVQEAEENREKDEQFKKNEDDPQFQQFQNYYNDLKKAVDEKDYEKIREENKKIEDLMKLSEELGQKMSSQESEKKEEEEEEIVDVKPEEKDKE
ncbi:11064_t:CDS:2 [Racocetra fulgida]|uniref:11064_t:CDS:1 n=1 Tax=Racocetra fulgida TaxID=60492 RepID=A0A9N8YSP1_9GLOM|nr:11064_t:CDS:2 [Racocetra fulgida]